MSQRNGGTRRNVVGVAIAFDIVGCFIRINIFQRCCKGGAGGTGQDVEVFVPSTSRVGRLAPHGGHGGVFSQRVCCTAAIYCPINRTVPPKECVSAASGCSVKDCVISRKIRLRTRTATTALQIIGHCIVIYCIQAFCSCGEQGSPFVTVPGLLIAVASLVEPGL